MGSEVEPKMLIKTNDSKQSHHELQIDVGLAFEMPIQSQESSSHNCAGMREQREEIDDASALLPKSQDGIWPRGGKTWIRAFRSKYLRPHVAWPGPLLPERIWSDPSESHQAMNSPRLLSISFSDPVAILDNRTTTYVDDAVRLTHSQSARYPTTRSHFRSKSDRTEMLYLRGRSQLVHRQCSNLRLRWLTATAYSVPRCKFVSVSSRSQVSLPPALKYLQPLLLRRWVYEI